MVFSCLTAITNSIMHLEKVVRSTSSLGKLRLLLCAKTEAPRAGNVGPKASVDENVNLPVVLWGPKCRKGHRGTQGAARGAKRRAGQSIDDARLKRKRVSGSPEHNSRLRGAGSQLEREVHGQSEREESGNNELGIMSGLEQKCVNSDGVHGKQDGLNVRNDGGTAGWKTIASTNLVDKIPHPTPSVEFVYTVPYEISAACLSLLSESFGLLNHLQPLEEISYKDLCGEELKNCVRLLLQRELKENEAVGEREHSTEKKTRNDLRYLSLAPKEYLGRKVSLPIMRLSRFSNEKRFTVVKNVVMNFRMRKPDKLLKDETFLILCMHLHKGAREGNAWSLLSELSETGITGSGCTVWKRMSKKNGQKSSGPICGGPDNCKFRPKPVCNILRRCEAVERSDVKIIGAGCVYPRITYFRGGVVPTGSIIASLSEVYDSAEAMPYLEVGVSTMFMVEKKNIERVNLLGPTGDVAGSAILVHENPTASIVSSGKVRMNASNASHVGDNSILDAVTVCDVRLEQGLEQDIVPYPYSDWYQVLSSPVSLMHFSDGVVPSTMAEVTTERVIEMFWHKRRISNRSLS